jgi:hypothetical protein
MTTKSNRPCYFNKQFKITDKSISQNNPVVVRVSELKLGNSIIDLFNGNASIYIANPWFEVNGVGTKIVKTPLKNLFKTHNFPNSVTFDSPQVYYKTDHGFTSYFLLRLFNKPRVGMHYKPYTKTYRYGDNKLTTSFDKYDYSDEETLLIQLEYKLRLALQYLFYAKLLNITSINNLQSSSQIETMLYERIKTKVFGDKNKDTKLLTLSNMLRNQEDLFTTIPLNKLKEPIQERNNSVAVALSTSSLKSVQRLSFITPKLAYLTANDIFMLTMNYNFSLTQVITTVDNKKMMSPLKMNEHAKRVEQQADMDFICKLTFNIYKFNTGVLSISVGLDVVQYYIDIHNNVNMRSLGMIL